jgi:hypothetical protein
VNIMLLAAFNVVGFSSTVDQVCLKVFGGFLLTRSLDNLEGFRVKEHETLVENLSIF